MLPVNCGREEPLEGGELDGIGLERRIEAGSLGGIEARHASLDEHPSCALEVCHEGLGGQEQCSRIVGEELESQLAVELGGAGVNRMNHHLESNSVGRLA